MLQGSPRKSEICGAERERFTKKLRSAQKQCEAWEERSQGLKEMLESIEAKVLSLSTGKIEELKGRD